MQKLITLLVTTAIGFLCGLVYFSEPLGLSTGIGFVVGLFLLTEIEIYHVDNEIKAYREKLSS